MEEEADRERTRSGDGHHQRGGLRSAPGVAEHAADVTADRSDPDRGERRVRGARAGAVRRPKEDEEPRPHGIELPHVAEVAERRQPHAAVREHAADLVRVEDGRREAVRAVVDE